MFNTNNQETGSSIHSKNYFMGEENHMASLYIEKVQNTLSLHFTISDGAFVSSM